MAIAVNSTRLAAVAVANQSAIWNVAIESTPAHGSTVIVTIVVASNTGAVDAVFDARGNAYAAIYDSGNRSVGLRILVFACSSQRGLQNGDFITVLLPGISSVGIAVDEVSGLGSQHVPDASAVAFSTSSVGTFSIGPTGTTAYADELVWAVVATPLASATTQTITAGAGYTQQGTRLVISGLALSLYREYKVVSATGAQTADGTFNTTNSQYVGVVLTFPAPQSPESTRRGASFVGAHVAAQGANKGASFVGASVAAKTGTQRASSLVGVEVAGQVTPVTPTVVVRRPSPIVA